MNLVMNPVYHLALFIIVGSSLAIDYKKLQTERTLAKVIYIIVFVAALMLWITQMLVIKIPVPTQIFLNKIEPLIHHFLHPGK